MGLLAALGLVAALIAAPAGHARKRIFHDPSVIDIEGFGDTTPPQPNAFDLIGRVQSSGRCQVGRTVIVHVTSAAGDAPVTTLTDSTAHWRATVHKPTPPFDVTAQVLRLKKKHGICRGDVGEDVIHYP